MTDKLARISPVRRTGDEPIHVNGSPRGSTLLDYWRWSASDIVSNSQRGVLAEFIVAQALGITLEGVRSEWDAFDLITPEGISIEVKSAAYIQSWTQRRLSSINFRIPKTRFWSTDDNIQETEARRQAQVYVFALLAHQDKTTIDPLNLDQWCFYVLPATVLNRLDNQSSIALSRVKTLAEVTVSYDDLREAVHQAAQKGLSTITVSR